MSLSSGPASPCSPLFVSRSAAAGLVGSPPIHRGAIDPSEQLMRVSAPRAGKVSERTRLAHGTAARGGAMVHYRVCLRRTIRPNRLTIQEGPLCETDQIGVNRLHFPFGCSPQCC